ncbi:hypothetical protein JRQ81_015004 [Phrynocephalus forsythii]|uniref:Ring finger protein 220 n=1 Tax=Phrynocephalus forsythii TaxID=171643 RepID=A0A9Q0XXS8_9SAUR|nr:hypothetical protein JRQ81_015004 [Phrynocephalus forsythii]
MYHFGGTVEVERKSSPTRLCGLGDAKSSPPACLELFLPGIAENPLRLLGSNTGVGSKPPSRVGNQRPEEAGGNGICVFTRLPLAKLSGAPLQPGSQATLLDGDEAPVTSSSSTPRRCFVLQPGKTISLAALSRKETPMDLHRAAFKMENSSYLPNPLASPALMVLASTAEASRDASIPCQQPRPFGVPVSVDKDVHIPFTNGSYTFASMYHRQGGVPGAFTNRDFPPSLLHLHPQFAPPNLDCTPISMLNHSGVGAFRPFASTEDRESYQSAFTPAKRLKNCHDTDSPHLRFSDADGKEYEFGAQLPSSSPSSLKVDDTGKKIFAVSGLISDRETSSSPEDRNDRCKYLNFA